MCAIRRVKGDEERLFKKRSVYEWLLRELDYLAMR